MWPWHQISRADCTLIGPVIHRLRQRSLRCCQCATNLSSIYAISSREAKFESKWEHSFLLPWHYAHEQSTVGFCHFTSITFCQECDLPSVWVWHYCHVISGSFHAAIALVCEQTLVITPVKTVRWAFSVSDVVSTLSQATFDCKTRTRAACEPLSLCTRGSPHASCNQRYHCV